MQIGNVTVPDNPHRLPTLLLDVLRIYKSFPKSIIKKARNDDTLAKLLGYASSRNGSYWNRLAALRHYGLLEGRLHVRLTEVARKLTTAQADADRSAAYFEAVCSIVLWRELYKRYKFNLPLQNLWQAISEITGCTTKEARSVESFVREAFDVDTNSIRTYNFEPPSGTLHVTVEPGSAQTQAKAQGNMQIEIRAGPYYHRMPFTSEGVKAAIEILRKIKAPDQKPTKQV
jgi:hypothetical protein